MPSKLIEASLRNSICENCASFKMENDLVWPLRDNLYLEKTKKYFSFKIFRFSCSSFSFFLIFFPLLFLEGKKKYLEWVLIRNDKKREFQCHLIYDKWLRCFISNEGKRECPKINQRNKEKLCIILQFTAIKEILF